MTLATGIDKDGLLGVAEVSRLVNLEPDVLTALVLQKSVRGGHVDGQTRIDLGSVVELTGKVPEGFVPVPSAAEMTGLRVRSLYRLIARGRVTGLSFYSQVHINLEELLEYTGPDVPKGYVWLLEAAERAGCTPDRLYALARRNRIHSIKHGGRVYVSYEHLTDYLERTAQRRRTSNRPLDNESDPGA